INTDEQVDLFSGLVWSGQRAVELGLADGFCSPGSVARDIIKTEKVENYTEKPSSFERWSKGFGVSVGHGIASSLNLNNQLQCNYVSAPWALTVYFSKADTHLRWLKNR